MSYPVTAVASISFPIPVLQSEAYSVPGSDHALVPLTPDTKKYVATSGPSITPANSAVHAAKTIDTKHIPSVDTVTLSTSQKVLKLQREGEGPLQIAATLNLPAKEVQSDLHMDTHVAQSFTVAPVTTPLSGNTTATVSVPTIGA